MRPTRRQFFAAAAAGLGLSGCGKSRAELRVFVYAGGRATDIWEQACRFQVLPVTPYPFPTTPDGTDHGVVYPDFDYSQI